MGLIHISIAVAVSCLNSTWLNPPVLGGRIVGQDQQHLGENEDQKSDRHNDQANNPSLVVNHDKSNQPADPSKNSTEQVEPSSPIGNDSLSNWAIVGISIALFGVTAAQIWLLIEQTLIFREYNAIAARQNDIATEQNNIMREQKAQTEAIITQMELDQRAWLAVGGAKLEEFIPGKAVKGSLVVKNCGSTPARVVAAAFASPVANTDSCIAPFLALFKQTPPSSQRQQHLFPGEKMTMAIGLTGHGVTETLTQERIDDINNRTATLFVIIYIKYVDFSERERETTSCYSFNPQEKRLFVYEKYNHMS